MLTRPGTQPGADTPIGYFRRCAAGAARPRFGSATGDLLVASEHRRGGGTVSAMTETTEQVETLIIGAGQAGLAAGYHLSKRGLPFLIVDANERIGDQWRRR